MQAAVNEYTSTLSNKPRSVKEEVLAFLNNNLNELQSMIIFTTCKYSKYIKCYFNYKLLSSTTFVR
jgi:hypothetical protein